MLQRLQTVYLLIVFAQCITCTCVDVGRYIPADDLPQPLSGSDYWPLLVFAILAALLVFAGIFLYRHRLLQMRACIYSILLLVAWYGFYFWHGYGEAADGVGFSPEWTAALPGCSIVLLIAALRCIWRDEMLVRSLDRLR